jgi:hypothetical protein
LRRIGGLDPNLAGTLEQWAHLLAEARDLVDLTAAYQGFDRFRLSWILCNSSVRLPHQYLRVFG